VIVDKHMKVGVAKTCNRITHRAVLQCQLRPVHTRHPRRASLSSRGSHANKEKRKEAKEANKQKLGSAQRALINFSIHFRACVLCLCFVCMMRTLLLEGRLARPCATRRMHDDVSRHASYYLPTHTMRPHTSTRTFNDYCFCVDRSLSFE
jgi:hypothetical protein